MSTSHDGERLRRSLSDNDLYPRLHAPDEDEEGGAEFYTAVGPDGKEIILRKYLQDQADHDMRIGFVSQALGHLQQEFGDSSSSDPIQHYHQQRELLNRGDRSMRSSFEYPPDHYYDEADYPVPRAKLGLEQKFSNSSMNRSPKHKIRTPIIEETESTVERELMSRDQSRHYRPGDSLPHDWASINGDNLNLSLSDSRYDGPEPQYAETKSSILRRRHSNAKLSNSSSDKSLKRKRRFNSMTDLPSSTRRYSNLRRRNSLSYEDLRGEELNQSRSTTLSTKKFTMYTGLSPKEKIEYNDYNDIR